MTNLIRSDLKRIFKDRLFTVLCIIGAAFAVFNPLLYVFLFSFAGEESAELTSLFSAKTLFFSAFSFSNNFGLIVPVLLAIILCKDFSFGTVRNKIISGHSRTNIFLSSFISCATVMTGVVLIYAFLTLGISLFFFEYQEQPFTAADGAYLAESILFMMLIFIFLSAFLCFLYAATKNVGAVIVIYVAFTLLIIMIASVIDLCLGLFSELPDMGSLINILEFIKKINIGNTVLSVGMGTEYNLEDFLYFIFSPLLCSGALVSLGAILFNKKDLK